MTAFCSNINPSKAVKSFETEAIRYIEWLSVGGDVEVSLPLITPSIALVTKRGVSPAADSELPTNWTYVGCYSDKQNARTLSAANTADNQGMDAAECIQFCSNKKYIYAGTEYTDGES